MGYGITATCQMDAEFPLYQFGYPSENEMVTEVLKDISASLLDENHVAFSQIIGHSQQPVF